jgi:hypothetical protein
MGGRRRVPDPRRMASAAVYGQALLLGQRSEAKALAAELRALSDGYPNGAALRAENAGLLAGGWFAYPGTRMGHELIAAGLLITAGPIDSEELISWLAEGQRRARTSWTASDF